MLRLTYTQASNIPRIFLYVRAQADDQSEGFTENVVADLKSAMRQSGVDEIEETSPRSLVIGKSKDYPLDLRADLAQGVTRPPTVLVVVEYPVD